MYANASGLGVDRQEHNLSRLTCVTANAPSRHS